MKIKHRIISVLLMISMMQNTGYAAYTEADVDFSDELTQIEELMKKCDAEGISYTYEKVNYKTIERFENYLKQDIADCVDDSITEYNVDAVQDLCDDTIASLKDYLSGDMVPKTVVLPNISTMSINGAGIYDSDTPMFSLGYGHSKSIIDDIPEFNEFGTDNIQLEVGPTDLLDFNVPFNKENHSTEYTMQIETENVNTGKFALRTEVKTPKSDNVYFRFTQEVNCKPNTTYTFGVYAKCIDNSTNGFSVTLRGNDWKNHVKIEAGAGWKCYSGSFTTSSAQTSLVFNICIDGEGVCYFDDMFVYESGKTENLLKNGDLEGGKPTERISEIINGLEQAESHNVGVNLLLSPHYFPDNVARVEYNKNSDGFIKYNINSPVAMKIIENHIRTLLSIVKDYDSLVSIILSNEPQFRTYDYPDFYNPLFREWLIEKYGLIKNLNAAYDLSEGIFGYGKTTYDSFDDISMPDIAGNAGAICYDWVEFNDEILADWHQWMADIVKEYTDKPISVKTMNNFRWDTESGISSEMSRGTDFEMFNSFSDFVGNDAANYYDDPYSYWTSMMLYDYAHSVTGKPVYNSETHIIRDGNGSVKTPYTPQTKAHVNNHLWMSAARGVSMHSIWLWGRSNDLTNMSSQSLLTRPDVVAGIGHTSLDMTRLSNEMNNIVQEKSKIALFYSKPSRIFDNEHMLYTYRAYQALINAGIKVGFVSEKSIDKLSEYDALILGDVKNASANTVSAVENFLDNGGKVLAFGDVMTKNEYNLTQTNGISSHTNCTVSNATATRGHTFSASDAIVSAVNTFISNNNLSRVQVKDLNGNAVTGLDWSYAIGNKSLLVNIANLEYDTAKNINVYLDGEKLSNMTELIKGTKNVTDVSLEGLEPLLLEYKFFVSEIYGAYVDAEKQQIVWEYGDGVYDGAEIYRLTGKDRYTKVATVKGTEYTYDTPGIYAVKAILDETSVQGRKQLYCTFGDEITLSVEDLACAHNNIRCKVTALNKTNSYIHTVVKVELIDENEIVSGYHYQTFIIPRERKNTFNISLPKAQNVSKIRISAADDKGSNNNMAEVIVIEL